MVLPDSHRVSRALCYSGFALTESRFRLRVFHSLWIGLPALSAIRSPLNARPTTPPVLPQMVWAVTLSLAATDAITELFSFPPGTKMVQFPGFAHTELCIHSAVLHCCKGLPHSDIPGSKPVRRLPEAFRSLPRLSSLLDA